MVENVEVVVINVVASKDIGDEFQDRGFSDASLSNNKNSVWGFVLSFDTLIASFIKTLRC